MSIYVTGLLWVLGAAALSAIIVVITRRFGSEEVGEKNLGAGGSVFSIVAGLHAVLAAFILISLFDASNAAEEQVQKEANALVAVDWSSDSLPEPAKSKVDQLIRAYVSNVMESRAEYRDKYALYRETVAGKRRNVFMPLSRANREHFTEVARAVKDSIEELLAEVDDALAKAKKYIYSQHKNGNWEKSPKQVEKSDDKLV